MIGIICAMQLEADGILALCEQLNTETVNGMVFHIAKLNGKDMVIVVCGVGKVNAAMCAATLINRYQPDLVINSGVAGAVSPVVSVGDIVIGTKAVEHDMNATALGDPRGEITLPNGNKTFFECDKNAAALLEKACADIPDTKTVRGIIASGDIFISERRQRLRINDTFGALACEMEGAAVGHVCYCCGVPFVLLRAISDDINENKGVDFLTFCHMAAEKTVRAIDGLSKML